LAFGMLTEDVVVECRTIPVDDVCPSGDVVREERTRPYLAASLGAAGAIALISAIDAYRGARRRNRVPEGFSLFRFDPQGARIGLPRVALTGSQTRIELFRLTF
jgi:hypothetical protein